MAPVTASMNQLVKLTNVLGGSELTSEGLQRLLSVGGFLKDIVEGRINCEDLASVPRRGQYEDMLNHYGVNSFAGVRQHWLDYRVWYIEVSPGRFRPLLEHYGAQTADELRQHWIDPQGRELGYRAWRVLVRTD